MFHMRSNTPPFTADLDYYGWISFTRNMELTAPSHNPLPITILQSIFDLQKSPARQDFKLAVVYMNFGRSLSTYTQASYYTGKTPWSKRHHIACFLCSCFLPFCANVSEDRKSWRSSSSMIYIMGLKSLSMRLHRHAPSTSDHSVLPFRRSAPLLSFHNFVG